MSDVLSNEFIHALATNARLRDGFVALLTNRIDRENSLDRVSAEHSVEHQKGRVAELRSLKKLVDDLEQGEKLR